jgi:short-subunit dehydrogenase
VEAYPYQGDAGTYDGVEGFWQFVIDLGRPVAAAALNVGVGLGGAFVSNDLDDEFRLIAVNITGTVHMAKRVVQHMAANGDGRILVVSSVSATTPTLYETVYGPSKAFGFSFAESLREELRDTGVSVTALLPGATDSDFHANAGMARTNIGLSQKNDKTLVARQGYEALIRGDDHIVGGDEATQQVVIDNRTIPEAVKAARMAELLRPGD